LGKWFQASVGDGFEKAVFFDPGAWGKFVADEIVFFQGL
jgi:hypothetical protein